MISNMVYDDLPWFIRSGGNWNGSNAGVFNFNRENGHIANESFRLVL